MRLVSDPKGAALLCLLSLWVGASPASRAGTMEAPVVGRVVTDPAMSIKVDPAALIEAAASKRRAGFKTRDADALARMEALITSYGARGRMANEPDVELRALYRRASELLMNGYPIAGGTLVAMARSTPAFAKSPAGSAIGAFVDAMLQPTEDDEDLFRMQEQSKRARVVLSSLRDDLRWYATLWVLGSIYHDAVAVEAGRVGMDAMRATAAEKRVAQKALAVR